MWSNRRYRFGVIAQFFNVAAQVCTWTYIIQYVQQALGGSLAARRLPAAVSLIVFLISRFVMTWVIGTSAPPSCWRHWPCCGAAVPLRDVLPNLTGVIALVAVSFCLSLMFPTIYGVALQGLGPATKFGAAGLVMAIVGGAIMPVIQGRCSTPPAPAFSFIVPAVCFAVVMAYALYDLKAKAPSTDKGEPEPMLAST